jgi:hypothetical protein
MDHNRESVGRGMADVCETLARLDHNPLRRSLFDVTAKVMLKCLIPVTSARKRERKCTAPSVREQRNFIH